MTKFITNQNIEIKLELAGLGDRIIAFLIDSVIIFCYAMFAAIIFSLFVSNSESFYYLLIILFLPVLLYSLLFEILTDGQSPGKKVREIKVVKLDGGSPTVFNYLLRWVLRPIDFFIYGGVAIMCIIVTKNGQRLGDLAAGTTVIKQRASLNISDIATIKKSLDHTVTYPQVKRLNDKQAELIRRALHMRRDGMNETATDEIASKTKNFLQIETDMPNVKFLYTVLKDYEYLHSA